MFGKSRISSIALVVLFGVVTASSMAQAGFIDDAPDGLAERLEVSRTTAEIILSCAVLMAIALPLSLHKEPNMVLIAAVMLGAVGMLTALQWLDPWLFVLICLIIALMYAGQLREWATSKKSG